MSEYEQLKAKYDLAREEREKQRQERRVQTDAEIRRVNITFSCIAIAYVLVWLSWPFVMRYVFSP